MSDLDESKKAADYGTDIKTTPRDSPPGSTTIKEGEVEVFSAGHDGVDFRTVGWVRAAMFFTKMTFATGVLSIPSALYTLGAVVGALFIVFWGGLNTCKEPSQEWEQNN